MKISNITGGPLLLSFLMQGKQKTAPSASYACFNQEGTYPLQHPGEVYAIYMPTFLAAQCVSSL